MGENILMLIPFLLTSLSFFTRISTRVSPYYLFRSARHYCRMRTEKGGDRVVVDKIELALILMMMLVLKNTQ